ncbi:sigma-54 interaction domain-containing protein [Brevibacillus porteri]|uniref:Transcriptional regulator n=1 Tax=Brevibacillus porteri TaxID=2126350 RepID=A0ABX5FIN9_9BACL|nr:sigma 54-interacting transcriptional regulator [Brevibacillus porteri]MED1797888.1 sigma 54-interacting transcriptional regulator [Brevibacillus porteri]MED2130974.1 sigma 54-interacting transcriptional regulator [Brevibacillus porteri]MED2746967.1 sigma 54-interacting transcriptional regulator [Brevibacillus porteri]MED2812933.1 sigma 54-interacting transcriptional regulator [Brevibacillus porteri]MED2892093.1 sigma 54-interacting transcriptional regulator [Brevibacillus porteri]
MPLRDIQESVQQIASAVASVLRVEVEIADSQFLRIAGTGKNEAGVLRTMAGEDHIYRESLLAGHPVVIMHPGQDERCRPCMHYGNCTETGEICCPIQLDNENIGVIGLLAFDEEQRERLFADVDAILTYLQKMAELIAIKLKEHYLYVEQLHTVEKLRVVMDEMDKAMFLVDQDNRIIQANQRARQYLQLDHDDSQMAGWIDAIRDADAAQSAPKQVVLSIGQEEKTFLFAIKPILLAGTVKEWVITLDDVQEVVQIARQVSGYSEPDAFRMIGGNSPAIVQAKEVARRVAASDSTVLLQGESGTGKELFARAIHQASLRRDEPFLSINCAAIPEHLMESELFGYEEGSFTGARKGGKPGLFEVAGKGTLFLDEIGDMPMHLQSKLLRVLQEKELYRIGGNGKPIRLAARIIAATHLDLQERVDAGLFRLDLYYRLHVIPIHLPSLRERREDILPLANDILLAHANRVGKKLHGFSQETQNVLFHHDWRGNVRELENVIEYAVNMEANAWVQPSSLPIRTGMLRESSSHSIKESQGSFDWQKQGLTLKELERAAIDTAMQQIRDRNGRKEEAAALLGISRATLFRKLREYGLT